MSVSVVATGRDTTSGLRCCLLGRPGRWMNVLRRIRSDDAGVGYPAGDVTPALASLRQLARKTRWFMRQTVEWNRQSSRRWRSISGYLS